MKYFSGKKIYLWLVLGAGLALLIDYWKTLPDYPIWASYPQQEYRNLALKPKSVDGKYGYANGSGEIIISARYDEVAPENSFFFMGKSPAWVKLNGKYGYIDREGKEVTPLRFDFVEDFDYFGLAKVRVGDKWGWVNRRGKEVIPPRFDETGSFLGYVSISVKDKAEPPGYGLLWLLNISPALFREYCCQTKVRIGKKWGYINIRGKEIVPPRFDEVYDNKKLVGDEVLALVREGDRWFWINHAGKEVTPSYLAVNNPKPKEFNGKFAYVDERGLIVIPPRFNRAQYFRDGWALAMPDDQWLAINAKGEVIETPESLVGRVTLTKFQRYGKFGYCSGSRSSCEIMIQPRFDAAYDFAANDRARVMMNGKWGYINSMGKEVIPLRFDYALGFFADDLAAVQFDGKWGYINARGETIISPRFDMAEKSEVKGFSKVMANGRYGWVSAEGKIIEPRFDEIYENNNTNYDILAMVRQGDRWFWIDKNGEESAPAYCNTEEACKLKLSPFSRRIGASYKEVGYGYYEEDHDLDNMNRMYVILPQFEKGSEFGSNGLAKVKKGGWGYINLRGETVVPLRYDEIGEFAPNGLARIMVNSRYGYVDTKGKEIIPPRFYEVHPFGPQGLTLVLDNKGKYGWLNTQGEAEIPARFDVADDFDANGLAKVSVRGKYGLINTLGEMVVPLRFDAIYGFAESGMAIVKLDGKYGYINAQGQEVIPPQFDEVETVAED
ncbi:hypothetical protein FACS189497_13140 [Betaproteobacteria bacterium]|nr:hypothetical protein FACS189497_13140 [Betaproteobacteria bacterium]